MSRSYGLSLALSFVCLIVVQAADQSASESAISESIVLLEARKAQADDPAEQAKIAKAISELESLLSEPPKPANVPALGFDVKPTVLKKKFQGRSAYNIKTGELTLIYDFLKKEQLKDFTFKAGNPIVANKALFLDGSDAMTHIAQFKSFAVIGVVGIKSLKATGIGSTNGTLFGTGGEKLDAIYLNVPGTPLLSSIVPASLRSGRIPFQFSITPEKTAVRWGTERMTHETIKKNDTHQVMLTGGTEGAAFGNLIITGVPEPKWFKDFLEAK